MAPTRELCDVFTLVVPDIEVQCSCKTVAKNTRCKSIHTTRYELSNGKTFFSCNLSKHMKRAIEHCKDGVTATICKAIFKKKVVGDVWNYEYKVIGVNVTADNDWECPLINNRVDPTITLKNISSEMRETVQQINDINDMIACLQNMIISHRVNLVRCKRKELELNNALLHMRSNSVYKAGIPWSKDMPEDTCAICHEEMKNDDSMKLHECSHAFHTSCIKHWFDSKESNKSCPCCRVRCNMNKYYIYSRYIPSN